MRTKLPRLPSFRMSRPVAVFAVKAVWVNQVVPSAEVSAVTVSDGVVPETAVISSNTLPSRNPAAALVPSPWPLAVRAADVSSVTPLAVILSSRCSLQLTRRRAQIAPLATVQQSLYRRPMIAIEYVDPQLIAPFQDDDVGDCRCPPQLARRRPAAVLRIVLRLVQLDDWFDVLHRLNHGAIRRRIVVVVFGDPAHRI